MDSIKIEQISKNIGKKVILQDVTFEIPKSKIFGLLGPNGAGKTTLIKLMVGMMEPTKGDISIFGHSIRKEYTKAAALIGSVVENPSFYESLTGYQNLKYIAGYHGGVSRSKIHELAELVDLKEHLKQKVKGYSLGMKQRLGLAASMLHDPQFLILDEPVNGLDPQGIIDLRNYLKKLAHEKQKTIIISSHLLSEIELICDMYGIMKDGRLLQTKDNVPEKNVYIFKVSNVSAAVNILKGKWSVDCNEQTEEVLVSCTTKESMDVINILSKNNVQVREINHEKKQSLEQSFLEITNKSS